MPQRRKKTGFKADLTYYEKKFVTPRGVASWAFLVEPFEGETKDVHKITLFFNPEDKAYAAFEGMLTAFEDAHAKSLGQTPEERPACIKYAAAKDVTPDKDGKQSAPVGIMEGQPFICFDTKPRVKDDEIVPIPVVDAGQNGVVKPTDEQVWKGDIARVQCAIVGWTTGKDRGIKCYLNGVQLCQSNKAGGSGVDAFTADDVFGGGDDATGSFAPETEGDAATLSGLLGDDE